MIGKKGIVLYIIALAAALAGILFGAYHFFFGGVQSDDTMKNMVNNQTSSEAEPLDPFDCVALFGIDTAEGESGRSDAIMLASIDSTTSDVSITTDLMGKISVIEHAPEIEQTAYGVFGDLLRVIEGLQQ